MCMEIDSMQCASDLVWVKLQFVSFALPFMGSTHIIFIIKQNNDVPREKRRCSGNSGCSNSSNTTHNNAKFILCGSRRCMDELLSFVDEFHLIAFPLCFFFLFSSWLLFCLFSYTKCRVSDLVVSPVVVSDESVSVVCMR